MKREFVMALAGVAVVVAGLAGCSNKACSGSTCGSTGSGTAKVTVDGKDQSVSGQILCAATGDMVNMTVGDQTKGAVTATVSGSTVQHVVIATAGTQLSFPGPGADAKVSKDGSKYSLSGHLAGADMSPHPFTMDITCP